MENGRFFTPLEVLSNADVCVLGQKTAEQLFGGDDPLEEIVWVNRRKCLVIGLLSEQEVTNPALRNQARPNESLYLPISTAINNLFDEPPSVQITARVADESRKQTEEGAVSSQRVVTRTSRVPAQGSLYGFDLGPDPTAVSGRSNLAVAMSINDQSGAVVGRVRLSQGPAYGADILRSVAWGWAIAGTVAAFLAALTGWLISRRLTQPLLALTMVTGRMAQGDLSARADVHRADELGILGHSFNQMAEQVENTVKSLHQFMADAAHELHTPLTALQTDLKLLAVDDDPAQQQRVVRAQNQALRLQDLADSLLELSWLEAESRTGERPLLNLSQLVQTSGELVASQAEQAGLAFEMQLSHQSILISGDESQLQRALVNVLDNSLKFTPAPGKIVLSLAAEKETAVITVRDSGIGILPEDLPQLFNRFHRGRNTAAYEGSAQGTVWHTLWLAIFCARPCLAYCGNGYRLAARAMASSAANSGTKCVGWQAFFLSNYSHAGWQL
jgi:signal transduction histidine kinase